jgi:hypothetical protein
MCFVRISKQAATISPYNMNLLVFVTEKQCAYWAVRTEYLNAIQLDIGLKELKLRSKSKLYFPTKVWESLEQNT